VTQPHTTTVVLELTEQAGRMLEDLVSRGIYGSCVADVAGRFVDERLQGFLERPVLKPQPARPLFSRTLGVAVDHDTPGPTVPFLAPALKTAQETLRRHLAQAIQDLAGDMAERVATDLDHAGARHPKWYAAVKRARRVALELGLADSRRSRARKGRRK
jgi:hypothetical protein